MSEDIYTNVIKTESKRRNRERVEMAVVIYESADCVGDHDFRTESNTQQPLQNTGPDSVKTRCSRAAPACLVLLCFLLLTAVIVLSVFNYTNNTNYTEERRQLLTNITNLTAAKDEILTNFQKERDQLIKQLQICGQEGGWFYNASSFYYLSNETKSWTESRRYCTDRGADLIIINNKREQDFIMKITGNNEFWIGVTDRDEEGIWKWVNGSTLTSGFWASSGSITEPNGGKTENCAVTYLKKHPELKGWLDVGCNGVHQWICEKSSLLVTI